MAHSWFGNLVTVSWWSDIGLDESFATFLSFLAMSRSPRLKHFSETCWITFLEYKFWGVLRDCLTSTHPICCHVGDTKAAEGLYDGIAYGKGAAFVKQLYNIVGYEAMSQGLHNYFEKHSWGNTTLEDLVASLAEAYESFGDKTFGEGFDLRVWCDKWLKTSGVNTLQPQVRVTDSGRLNELKIR